MSALDEWVVGSNDISKINDEIKKLEAERKEIQSALDPATQLPASVNLDQIINSLQSAVVQGNILIIDQLESQYPKIDVFEKLKTLLIQREELKRLKSQNFRYTDLLENIDSMKAFDLERVEAIASSITEIDDSPKRQNLLRNLDCKLRSFGDSNLEQFKRLLSTSKWINSTALSSELRMKFIDLIDIQSVISETTIYPMPLWAFEQISKNFKTSFDYHFNSQRETNRIDRPELFLQYTLKYFSDHLLKINRLFNLDNTKYSYRYAHNEFITAALIPVKEKMLRILTLLRKELADDSKSADESRRLLIHLISETILFDKSLVNEYFYDPLNNGLWPGLFEIYNYTDLEQWLNLEVKNSISNVESILSSSNVFSIDYTSVDPEELKPTVSAIKLKYLLENVTKKFSNFFQPFYGDNMNLQKFKLKYFAKIYLGFLESYLRRLDDGYDAFLELFKRTKNVLVSNPQAEIDISGVHGLERILRIYSSVKFTSNFLHYWDYELIFVELNDLFNKISNNNSSSLFSSTILGYSKLATQSFDLIHKFLQKVINVLMKSYTRLNSWRSIDDTDQITLSPEISSSIDSIEELLFFISKVVTKEDSRLIKNRLSYNIAYFFLTDIIKSNHFSHGGVKQLELDFITVWEKLQLSNEFPLYYQIIESFQVMNLDDEQITQYGSFNSVSQFAKAGHFATLIDILGTKYLNNNELMDLLLRIA